ncbi:MAG: ATP synthase F1 subunit gamma [Halobacteriovoraceae bacterium]|nr:ATP synthase F1 subunit gamma [Halobacteriovoraceae bacterium]|tara:strand:- start:512 stop:1378 length:867 start_codon:yes stop_codon:yes gene_type:complete
MANIKELKVRISSTKSTLKITSAMKLVSAAKLSRAQGNIQSLKPYSNELDSTIRTASALADDYSHEFLEAGDSLRKAIVVISSNKGLCGGYNSQLYKQVKRFMGENPDADLLFMGRKVRELAKRDGFKATRDYVFEKAEPRYDEVVSVVNELTELFKSGKYGEIYIAFNSFVSAIEFTPTVKPILPFSITEAEKAELVKEFPVDFKYEPSAEVILDALIPEVLVMTVYASVLDAIAAEHASRMTAMDNATNNSKDMIRTLTLKANKLRQAAITTELTEIVSGAESLNG